MSIKRTCEITLNIYLNDTEAGRWINCRRALLTTLESKKCRRQKEEEQNQVSESPREKITRKRNQGNHEGRKQTETRSGSLTKGTQASRKKTKTGSNNKHDTRAEHRKRAITKTKTQDFDIDGSTAWRQSDLIIRINTYLLIRFLILSNKYTFSYWSSNKYDYVITHSL